MWGVPALIILVYGYWQYRKKQVKTLGQLRILEKIAPGIGSRKNVLKNITPVFIIALLILAYANPQWGNKKEKVKIQSSDVFIALDISQSMMAEDVSPNRLERAKRLGQNLIQALKGNRIGLIYFAGNAYLQMPLSSDYSAALMFLSSANTNQAGTQGTAISEAIQLALRAFENDKATQRAMIIITDGETHDQESIAQAREAREMGLKIFTIGIGTEEGAFVPYGHQGRELYKRDENGNPVTSVLNTSLVKDLAEAGGGKSFLIGQGNQIISGLKRDIALLEKEEIEQRAFSDYASYFQYFLFLGILVLLVHFFLLGFNPIKNAVK